jgi:transposase-like protein
MLVELSVMEQRCHAVMEVISGAPVTEVARRYGVSRQAVHLWLGKYQREGLTGLADHSHRPRFQPRQLRADIEAMACQLRGAPALGATTAAVRARQGPRDTGAVPVHDLPGAGPARPGPGP